jgi:hypothetical protein
MGRWGCSRLFQSSHEWRAQATWRPDQVVEGAIEHGLQPVQQARIIDAKRGERLGGANVVVALVGVMPT